METFGSTMGVLVMACAIFLVNALTAFLITHIHLNEETWRCTKYTEWRIYGDEQRRDCIQYTLKEAK